MVLTRTNFFVGIIATTILIAVVIFPNFASAQAMGGFLNCSGTDCSACNVVYTANKLIAWLIGILFVVFAVLMVKAGFGLVMSGGNKSALDAAKSSFTNAIIGLLIILGAWIIVDTLIRGLGVTDVNRSGPLPWSEVQCQSQVDPHAAPAQTTPSVSASQISAGTTGQSSPQAGCANCEQMSSYVACSNRNSCTIDAAYAVRMRETLQASGEAMLVTEGYPRTREHQNACHYNGTCVDIVFQDRQWSEGRVTGFQTAAQANGCRAVYEPNSSGSCPSGSYVRGRANNTCMPYSVTQSTGNHFSLYCN